MPSLRGFTVKTKLNEKQGPTLNPSKPKEQGSTSDRAVSEEHGL